MNENSAQDTTVGVLNTVDPDSGQTHTYTLLDSAGGRFKLQRNSLKVQSTSENTLLRCTTMGLDIMLILKYYNIISFIGNLIGNTIEKLKITTDL